VVVEVRYKDGIAPNRAGRNYAVRLIEGGAAGVWRIHKSSNAVARKGGRRAVAVHCAKDMVKCVCHYECRGARKRAAADRHGKSVHSTEARIRAQPVGGARRKHQTRKGGHYPRGRGNAHHKILRVPNVHQPIARGHRIGSVEGGGGAR
jgi:hypothetical protein